MDTELRFIAALLHSNTGVQEAFFARQIPAGIFQHRGQEIAWVYTFRAKHGRYPSIFAYAAKFGEKLKRPQDNVSASLQPVLDVAMFDQLCKFQQNIRELIDGGTPMARVVQAYKAGSARLHIFDADYKDIDFAKSKGALLRYQELRRAIKDPNSFVARTPWASLNRMIKMLRSGETFVLASRTSLGKTWQLLNWAHFLAEAGAKVLFITREMTTEAIEDRVEALHFKLPYDLLREGKLPFRVAYRWKQERR